MIHTIIFSKNRAAQLDQLLQSIYERAPGYFFPIDVLYLAGDSHYLHGYQLLRERFPDVRWTYQHSFEAQCNELLHQADDIVTFLCDDDLITRNFDPEPSPSFLLSNKKILTVSLRLGLNTTDCYPLRRPQHDPAFLFGIGGAKVWNWTTADGDWGYPGSLDGHVFRRIDLLDLLWRSSFSGPNRLEEELVRACETQTRYTLAACYQHSYITGCPLNLVNTTHTGNRNGETHHQHPEALNLAYLEGKRPMVYPIEPERITAAHTELPIIFQAA